MLTNVFETFVKKLSSQVKISTTWNLKYFYYI